jgi:hypothetical protein
VKLGKGRYIFVKSVGYVGVANWNDGKTMVICECNSS